MESIHIEKHFGKYEITKCPVPSWLRKSKAGSPAEVPFTEKGSFMQVSRPAEDQFCFFLYGSHWGSGDFHDPKRNSFISIEWDGISTVASVCIGMDENQRLLESKFDNDGNLMVALGFALGHLQIHGEGDAVKALNTAQVTKARKFLADQFLAKTEAGQAEAFGKALDGKRARIIEMRDSLANWNGHDYWTDNEDEIIHGIGEAMKEIATESDARPLTRECILEQINIRRRDAKRPKGKCDPDRYSAVDAAWISRKIARLGLSWI